MVHFLGAGCGAGQRAFVSKRDGMGICPYVAFCCFLHFPLGQIPYQITVPGGVGFLLWKKDRGAVKREKISTSHSPYRSAVLTMPHAALGRGRMITQRSTDWNTNVSTYKDPGHRLGQPSHLTDEDTGAQRRTQLSSKLHRRFAAKPASRALSPVPPLHRNNQRNLALSRNSVRVHRYALGEKMN